MSIDCICYNDYVGILRAWLNGNKTKVYKLAKGYNQSHLNGIYIPKGKKSF